MHKRYKFSQINVSARRPNTRSHKAKHIKVRLTACIFALLIAVIGVYSLVKYMRTDHKAGGVKIVVGEKLMASIPAEDLKMGITIEQALESVAVRPTSMQAVILMGPEIEETAFVDELDAWSLIAGEKRARLLDENGAEIGVIERIYLPLDE